MDLMTFKAVERLGKKAKSDYTRLSFPIFSSRTWVAPMDGVMVLRSMPPGGSGAKGPNITGASVSFYATGGYTGPWGGLIRRVKKGGVVVIVHGAPGAGVAGSYAVPGLAGGNNIITVGGKQYTLPGGPGGVYSTTLITVPEAPVLPPEWDFGANGVKPGIAIGPTGGAGVDILMQGNNATTSASSTSSGGGGTGGPSVGTRGGGATPNGTDANGSTAVSYLDASSGAWGISFYGGNSGGNGGGGNGNPGSGGDGSGVGGNGGNGGGGGAGGNNANITAANASRGGNGGLGAGGGAVTAAAGAIYTSGSGGNAYTHIEFFPDMSAGY